MKKHSDLKLIIFFTALTFLMTLTVVLAWEKVLLPPFYAWVEARYPGDQNEQKRWHVQQRVEHFFISITVDMVVVTLLLRVVRRQQRRLVESEERYRALFEHANDGIGVVAVKGHRLLEANSKFYEILGCRPSDVMNRDIGEFLQAPATDREPQAITDLLDGTKPGDKEMTVRRSTGELLPVHISFNALGTSEDDKLLILIIRDLSQSKQLEAEKDEIQRQLFQSSKLASIGELSAGVAHEINNPLNGIINFAQLLKDEEVPRSEFERQMIDGIIDEGGRIAHIVRGLLTFARHDTHELRHVHIAECIRTSIALFGRQLEKDGIRVRIEIEPDLPAVRADGSRLRQVVVNMISNAHHALKAKRDVPPEGKVFRITARRAARDGGACVRVEFYDNGVGIRAGDQSKVFDPFFTTRRDVGGTGLGLSISFGIIRDYDGTISVESVEGQFTCFRIDLPAIESWEAEYA